MALGRLRFSLLGTVVLSAVSCRSILDITPGVPLEDATGGSSSQTNGGDQNTSQSGSSDSGGVPEGGTRAITSKGGSGPSSGGGSAQAGAETGGEGGEAGASTVAVSPFPEGACRDCMARNCSTETDACTGDASCAQGVAAWIGCTESDASACVTATQDPLESLQTCGAKSCDLCRHLTDNTPSIEILTPSNGANVQLDATGLIEVSVRVHNFTVAALGACGTDTSCGHIHLNLDGANCHQTPFYNQWVFAVDADGSADSAVDTQWCKTSIAGRPIELVASLSSNATHADRTPPVQADVTITVTPSP
jgi:hypothetical protein